MSSPDPQTASVALVDTTIAVDYFKMAARRRYLIPMLGEYDIRVTTSIGLLEFKAVLIQEMITIHGRLAKDQRFTTARDALLESTHRQSRLRAHIFNNQLNVFAREPFQLTLEEDRKLAREARQKLEVDIPELLEEFRNALVDGVLADRVNCDRAKESPTKRPNRVAFEPNIPKCVRGKNKFCSIESVVRERVFPLLDRILPDDEKKRLLANESASPLMEQFGQAWLLARSVAIDPTFQMSASDCRRCGDALIAVEAEGHVSDALSTNAREWQALCDQLGLRFRRVEYPAGS